MFATLLINVAKIQRLIENRKLYYEKLRHVAVLFIK